VPNHKEVFAQKNSKNLLDWESITPDNREGRESALRPISNIVPKQGHCWVRGHFWAIIQFLSNIGRFQCNCRP